MGSSLGETSSNGLGVVWARLDKENKEIMKRVWSTGYGEKICLFKGL
jgi:hypothetical protein